MWEQAKSMIDRNFQGETEQLQEEDGEEEEDGKEEEDGEEEKDGEEEEEEVEEDICEPIPDEPWSQPESCIEMLSKPKDWRECSW
jgi:hypothetical protein